MSNGSITLLRIQLDLDAIFDRFNLNLLVQVSIGHTGRSTRRKSGLSVSEGSDSKGRNIKWNPWNSFSRFVDPCPDAS